MLPALPIDDLVSVYSSGMSWLHSGTARNVTVYFDPMQSGCPNHSGYDFLNKRAMPIYNSANPFPSGTPTIIPSLMISGILNIHFASGTTCPVCNGKGDILSPASGVVDARVQWRNRDVEYNVANVGLQWFNADVRLKVLKEDVSVLERAKKVVIDGKTCKLQRAGVPVGFRDIHSYYFFYSVIQ